MPSTLQLAVFCKVPLHLAVDFAYNNPNSVDILCGGTLARIVSTDQTTSWIRE